MMEPVSQLTDEQLVANIKQGSQSSCETLFKRYLPLLLSISKHPWIIGIEDDLFGHLQITFLEAIQEFDDTEHSVFPAYIKLVLSNAATDFQRHLCVLNKYDEFAIQTVDASAETPLEYAMKQLDYDKVHEAISLLPDYERELLTKIFIDGIDLSHLNWQYHHCTRTLRNHRKRALHMLKRQLEKLHLNCIPTEAMPSPAPITLFPTPTYVEPMLDDHDDREAVMTA